MPGPNLGKYWGRKIIAGLTIGAGIVGADRVRRYHVEPKQLCGIPPANYQPPQPPPVVAPVLGLSAVGQVLTLPATTPAASTTTAMSLQIPTTAISPVTRIKVFQFVPTSLVIDHCSISRIAINIQNNGYWTLNLQADQNPLVATSTALTTVQPPAGKPALPTAPIRGLPDVRLKQTSFLKRNLFVVRVRGLGNFAEALPVPAKPASLGKPVLLAPAAITFWVQNGVPYPLVATSFDRDAKTFFDMIDRVEIEFSYR